VARTYKLDHFTKGTGASVAPVDDAPKAPADEGELNSVRLPAERRPRRATTGAAGRTSSPLPPGHVRKRSTGEIGKVRAVDPRAGTADVQWLHGGQTSTVRLDAITRR
jgi:hypothetical protein